MRRPIKNKYYQTIGWLEDATRAGKHVIWALSFKYTKLGYYDTTTDKSYNFFGQFLGVGDMTSSMIWENYNKDPKRMGEK